MNKPIEHTVYECPHCEDPTVYTNEEDALKHMESCLMNPDNRTWLTHKDLGVYIYPPLKKHKKEYREGELFYFLGYYHVAFDIKTGKEIPDIDLVKRLPDDLYEEAEKYKSGVYKEPKKVHTKEYEEYLKPFKELDKEMIA